MTYVAFDKRSGQILSVHHGAVDPESARKGARHHKKYQARYAQINDEHVGVMSVPEGAVERGKQYKVDISREALVPAEGPAGVGFSFGIAGRSH
jgi:hypothetical protein